MKQADSALPTHAPSGVNLARPLLVLVVAIIFLDVQLGTFGINPGNLFLFSGSLLVIVISAVRLQRKDMTGVSIRAYDWIYLAYLAFAAASALWAPAPINTIVGVVYLAAFWIATLFLTRADLLLAARYVVLLAVLVAVLSFLSIPISPTYAFQPVAHGEFPELRGIFGHQLRLGLFMAIALGIVVIAYFNGDLDKIVRRRRGFVILILLICLVAAYARLYTAAAAVSVLLTLGLSRAGWVRATTIALACFGAIFVYLGQDVIFALLEEGDFDLTLTGRTRIWERIETQVQLRPWLGFGYASFDHPSFDGLFGNYRPAHPHNSFLQARFETGLIGYVLTLVLVAAHFLAAMKVHKITGKYSYSLFFVILTVLGSLTGANYASKPSLLFSLLLLFLAIETRRYQLAYRSSGQREEPERSSGAPSQVYAPQH